MQGLELRVHCLCVDSCCNARIDQDFILAFLCVVFLCMVTKIFTLSKLDAVQCNDLASLCDELALIR